MLILLDFSVLLAYDHFMSLNCNIKTGIGFDVHAFSLGRDLILGGVKIPHDKGLMGHSDADVLSHTIADAIAGVCLGEDIGSLFPDTDPAYKGADSILLLKDVLKKSALKGYKLINADAVLIAQKPRLLPYIKDIRISLSKACEVAFEDLTVKSTTTEHLGFVGREEGIACVAVVTVVRSSGVSS